MKWIPGIGSPQSPLGPQGTPWARPWDPPGTRPGPPVDPGDSTDHKNGHTSTSLQRQKLSIAAYESFRCNASPQGLPWTVLSWILR